MQSQVHSFPRENGELQRVHVVRLSDWEDLAFFTPEGTDALEQFFDIYRNDLIPVFPWAFGNLLLFSLPGDMPLLPCLQAQQWEPLTAAAVIFRKGLRLRRGKPYFLTAEARELWQALAQRDALRTVRGKLPHTQVIPVSSCAGFLSDAAAQSDLCVNASFFIMDPFDCATVYDHVGTAFGLRVKDGVIESPPLFSREALLVKRDGSVCVEIPRLEQLTLTVGGTVLRPGENARIFSRPQYARTPASTGKQLVIVGSRVAAVVDWGCVPVPAGGFVLCPQVQCTAQPGDRISFGGMEDVAFGVQVGNSIVKNGVKTQEFVSSFYNLRALERVPYPPCLYPMGFGTSRAARMAIGADRAGKPMLLWAEGAAKRGHVPGVDSCGATLRDMADMCAQLGMVNGVNLDGGGSAQLLLHGQRLLQISGRDAKGREVERPVPVGIRIR